MLPLVGHGAADSILPETGRRGLHGDSGPVLLGR